MSDLVAADNADLMERINDFMKAYPRLVYMINIPLMAICTSLFFRKSKLNFTEHVLLNAYSISAQIAITIPIIIVTIIFTNKSLMTNLYTFSPLIMIAYTLWYYYQLFSVYDYKKWKLVVRALLAIASTSLFQGIVLAVIVGAQKIT